MRGTHRIPRKDIKDIANKSYFKGAILRRPYHTTGFVVGITNDNITSCVLEV